MCIVVCFCGTDGCNASVCKVPDSGMDHEGFIPQREGIFECCGLSTVLLYCVYFGNPPWLQKRVLCYCTWFHISCINVEYTNCSTVPAFWLYRAEVCML